MFDVFEELHIDEGITKIERAKYFNCHLLKKISLPSTLETIDDLAFSGCINLEEIVIPDNVTSIGISAFANCKKLKRIIIPNSLKIIKDLAFSGCDSIETITLPDSLENGGLKKQLFLNCHKLKTVIFSKNITELPDEMFKGCRNLDIVLPLNITKVGNSTFEDCSKLSTVSPYIEEMGNYSFKGCKKLEEVHLNKNITELKNGTFEGCTKLKDILSENKIEIGKRCFRNCISLKKIPKNIKIKSNSSRAFENCTELESVDIKDLYITSNISKIIIIPESLFRGCKKLKKVYNSSCISSMGSYVFSGCDSLEEIYLNGINKISPASFSNCKKLRKVKICEGTKTIGNRAFYKCPNLSEVKLPDSIAKIGTEAFRYCKNLKSIYIPEKLKQIGYQAYRNMDSLENIEVSKKNKTYLTTDHKILINSERQSIVLYASGYKEEEYALTKYVITIDKLQRTVVRPIESIDSYAFADATNLKKLTINPCTKDIDVTAFYGCNNLKELEIETIDIFSCPGINLRENYYYFFMESSKFKPFLPFETIRIKGRTQQIFQNAFQYFTNVKKVELDIETPFSIGNNAFKDCEQLESIEIPNNIESFEKNSFSKKTNIKLQNELRDEKVISIQKNSNYKGNYKIYYLENDSSYIEDEGVITLITKKQIVDSCKNADSIYSYPEVFYEYTKELKKRNIYKSELLDGNLMYVLYFYVDNLDRDIFFDSIKNNYIHIMKVLKNSGLLNNLQAFISIIKKHKINYLLNYIKVIEDNNVTIPILQDREILNSYDIDAYDKLVKNDHQLLERILKSSNLLDTKTQGNLAYYILTTDTLNDYVDKIIKHNINDKFLYQIPFMNVSNNELFEELLKVFDANLKRTIIASKALLNESADTNLNDLLCLLKITGALSENKHTRQQSTTFLTEKIFAETISNKRNKYQIIGDDIHSIFNFTYVEDYNPEFGQFFRENYKELIDEEKDKSGFIQRVYSSFSKISETATSNKGSQRKLKVTIYKCKCFLANTKFDQVNSQNMELASLIGDWFDDNNVWLRTLKVQKESLKAPRNIFTKIEYTKDDKPIYDMNPDKDLKEEISPNYSYEWLPKQDKENYVLGKYCNCCAHIDGAGDGIMRASIILDNCQNLVIRNENGRIIAKSTLYVNKNEGYGVFNNVETSLNYRTQKDIERIYKAFIRGAKAFIETYNNNNPDKPITNLSIGENRNTLISYLTDINNHPKVNIQKSLSFGYYSLRGSGYNGDWQSNQRLVVKR